MMHLLCMHTYERERERQRQRQRQRHRQTDRQTDRQTETERYDVMYVKALEQLKYFYLLISNIIHLKVCH